MSNYGYKLRVILAARDAKPPSKFRLFKKKVFTKAQVLTRMRKVNMSRYMGNVIKKIEAGL